MMTHKIYGILDQLEKLSVYYQLASHRNGVITVLCTQVGLRLEIDVFADGAVVFSKFSGDESVSNDEQQLWTTIKKFSDSSATSK